LSNNNTNIKNTIQESDERNKERKKEKKGKKIQGKQNISHTLEVNLHS
jgi:hypothetical protein